MPRLRRTAPDQPGWTRRRAGRGFAYLDERGVRLPREDVVRVRALVIPPAWSDVWICPDPEGHLQAVGTDDAGRRQYLYHPRWRERQDRRKHERALDLAQVLPAARERVDADLRRRRLTPERVLAAGFRLLDLGALRIGGERYARENGTYGLVTLRREHVAIQGRRVRVGFVGKAGKEQLLDLDDAALRRAARDLLGRDDPDDRLLAWHDGERWHPVSGRDVNAYVQQVTGLGVSAKDLRTLRATVVAAAALGSVGEVPPGRAARRRLVAAAVREVAEHLGNTPAVARTSYVDPRVLDAVLDGEAVPVPPLGAGDLPAVMRCEAALVSWLRPAAPGAPPGRPPPRRR